MRAIVLALALAGCAQPPAGGGGIVSLNPCADAMLVRLAPASRIAAISRYSHDPAATSLPLAVARRFPAVAGTAEEVIARAPDLVVASAFTQPATRDAFARAGLRTLYLDAPQTIAENVAQVRQLAAAVGARAAGERMVQEIERAVTASVPRRRTPDSSPESVAAGSRRSPGRDERALLFIGGDLATGSGTLLNEMMTRAGFANAAAGYGLVFTGRLPAEVIAADPPDVVIAPEGGRGAAMRRRVLRGVPEARFAQALINCGGPAIAPAMQRLRAIRDGLA